MSFLIGRKRLFWNVIRVIGISVILLLALAYINDKPGGFADWRMSKAMGAEGTIRIPLGKTAEDAIKQFRHYTDRGIVHKETVKDGVLLFYKQLDQDKGSDLQIEFVRKAWFGWKWVMGGGYGISGGQTALAANSSLTFMSMAKMDKVSTPFPIVFGDILDPLIKQIRVVVKGTAPGIYLAKFVVVGPEKIIWFVFLPAGAGVPYDIEGLNKQGERIAFKTITDPQDTGLINVQTNKNHL